MSVSTIGFLVDPETHERIAYNRETGEILRDVCPPVVLLRRSRVFNQMYGSGMWWVMAEALANLMAFDKEITRQEPMRVFWYLVTRLDFENFIRVSQREIAEALGMQKSHVSRAIKLLENKGVLLRGQRLGQSYSWQLNPNCGFKGNPRGKVVRLHDGKLVFSQTPVKSAE